uniref:(northern house mosquito) hypothetical protein n=1 Tax=Culex pipiens TaxID=7175 RepID=A0A8D8KFV1_CULPI
MFTHKLQVEARFEYLGQQAREYLSSQITAVTHMLCHDLRRLCINRKKGKTHRNQLLCLASCRCRTFRDFFVCSPLFGRRSSLEWTYHSYSGGRLLTRQNGRSVGCLEHRIPQADVRVMVGVHVSLRWWAVACVLLPQRTGTTGIFLQF